MRKICPIEQIDIYFDCTATLKKESNAPRNKTSCWNYKILHNFAVAKYRLSTRSNFDLNPNKLFMYFGNITFFLEKYNNWELKSTKSTILILGSTQIRPIDFYLRTKIPNRINSTK